MKIEREYIETIDIAVFADRHDLTMVVRERAKVGSDRFYASLKNVDVIDGGCLVGTFGNGATEDEAIAEYAKILSCKRIAIFAWQGEKRINVNVPRLNYTPV